MKLIADSDFYLLIEKLPIILQYAKGNIPHADLKALNAMRRMALLQKKLSKQHKPKSKKHDKK